MVKRKQTAEMKPFRSAMKTATEVTEGVIGYDGRDMYIDYAGQRIAVRGHPDTPHAKKWIPLVHGVRVLDVDNGNGIEIQFFNESASGALM